MTTVLARPAHPEEVTAAPVAPPAPAAVVNGSRASSFRVVGAALSVLSVLLLAFAVHVVALSGLQQGRTQDVLYKDFRHDLSQAVAPVGGAVAPGEPVAVLDVPGLSLRQVVVEGTRSGELMKGPGHRRDTALPGQAGVSAIVGRRAAYGGPFAAVDALRPGDPLAVFTGQGRVTYVVERIRTEDDVLPPPVEAGAGRLVLVTADEPFWPREPILVDARQTSPVQPTPAGRPGSVSEAEGLMQGDPAAVLPLALWAQLLAAAVLCLTWAHIRWGRRQAYLVGVPVLVLVLWNLCENVTRLLPNVL